MKINLNDILDFFKSNYKTIAKVILIIFLLYWVIYIFTPSTKVSEESQKKLDNLSVEINKLQEEQVKLHKLLEGYESKIDKVDNNIQIIKNTKIQVAKDYEKKINSITYYSNSELTEFFTKRYSNLY